LAQFASREELGGLFSEDLSARFEAASGIGLGQGGKPGQEWRRHVAHGMKLLTDYARHGRIGRVRTNVKDCQVSPAMEAILQEYDRYCRERLLLRPSTLQGRARVLRIFLDFLRQQHLDTLGALQAGVLSEYLSSRRHLAPVTLSREISDLRSFLRFLTMRGILHQDLRVALPRIRLPRDACIPSVWSPELVDKLLLAIDRSSAKGRRDYAIVLLACRLGLRAGDIRKLRLEHINWDEARIEITQAKTGAPLHLPLSEEVGQALIAYLRSGRPKTACREIFLKLQPPFAPFGENNNLHYIVTYWRQLAGISFRSPQRRGLHSLRHSLATRLLQMDTPVETIAGIMGHATLASTRIYAKADVEGLRSVALDPEEASHAAQ
jgi:integrase